MVIGMANRIGEVRRAKKMKQIEVAKALGVDQSTVSGWERETREADHDTLRSLADLFGVSVDYLLGISDNPDPAPSLPHEKYREVLAGPGLRLLLDADANLTEDQLQEIIDFIEFKRRQGDR